MKIKIMLTGLYLLFHLAGESQTQRFFIQLFDANGKSISGNSVVRGFEKQIEASSLTGSLQHPRINFTMVTNPASGMLQRMIKSGDGISSGLLTVAQQNNEGRLVALYTIKIESAQVLSCTDQPNSNGSITLVELQTRRMGITYYQQDRKSGISKTGSKAGFDWTTNKEWKEF